MLYARSLAIEARLQAVLQLIETSDYSTPELADEIGVSIPTISRDVNALRQRGHDIRAERIGERWHYRLVEPSNENARRKRRRPR